MLRLIGKAALVAVVVGCAVGFKLVAVTAAKLKCLIR